MLPSLPVGLFQADRDGRITTANPAFSALVEGSSNFTLGMPAWSNAHPGDRAAAELAWRRAAEAFEPVQLTFRIWRGDGRMTWVRVDGQPIHDTLGRVVVYGGTAVDQTNEIVRDQLLERLQAVMGASKGAVIILDRNGAAVYTNDAAKALFGVNSDLDLVRDPAARGFLQAIRDQVPREVTESTVSGSWSGEVGFRGPDGLERTLELDLLLQRTSDGLIEFWGGIARDITATRQLQDELTRQANHDPLTGLPNRLLLLRTAAEALDGIRGTRNHVAMLFIDVDKLKDVNDTVGHDVGDALLSQVAHRLAHTTRPTDVVARIGGDEFVVLCEGTIDEHILLDLAERIRHALSGRAMVHSVEIDLSVSIGLAISGSQHMAGMSGHEGAIELLRNADTAMYQAKRRGRSRTELYTDVMRAASRDHKELSGHLEQAIALDQLRLAYQPIISTHSSRVAGAEAFLRWDHPQRGTLLPAQFLHLAEESGAIVPIGDWVLRQACVDARAWIDAGLVDHSFSVHVNVAPRQLAEGSFVERVLATVRQLELSPHQLTLDFDEDTLYDSQPGTMRSLQALRRFGVRLSLDRFGAGVSSLTALRTCEADVVKLDGSIARMLGSTGGDDPIVRSIIQLAHALDKQVVAEWVTSADQLRRLRVLGCDMVQGHLLGEPAGADVFASRARSLNDQLANVLTFAVLGYMGVRLVTGLRRSRTYEGRSLVHEVVRNIRWRHVWPVPILLAVVIAVATTLMQIPGLDWGWWTALGGSGNPVFGSSDSTNGTVWEWLIPLVFMCLLFPALPLFAYAEERLFRAGAELWSRRRRVFKVLQFGLIHALIGIPIGAALALSIGGAYFMWVYLRHFRIQYDRRGATIASTTAHAVYNGLIVVVVIVAVIVDAVS